MQNLIINAEPQTSVSFTAPTIDIHGLNDLETKIKQVADKYNGLIVNEDDIKQAKKEKAELVKLSNSLNEKRIAIKKEVSKPIKEFDEEIKRISNIIDEPVENIKVQVKKYTEQAKEDKKQQIIKFINEVAPKYGLNPNDIRPYEEDKSLLNASTSKKKWQDTVMLVIERRAAEKKRLAQDRESIKRYADRLGLSPESYYHHLENMKSINEIYDYMDSDLNRQKATQEAQKAKQSNVGNKVVNNETGEVVDELKEKTYTIKATTKQLSTLTSFMYANGIEFQEDN